MKPSDLNLVPPNLPEPRDDGGCSHLPGRKLPSLSLRCTQGSVIDLAKETVTPMVLFFFPKAWRPSATQPKAWKETPGAWGCQLQAAGFRDLHEGFLELGIQVLGVNSQSSEEQVEFINREKLPFELLSDERFALAESLILPTFQFSGQRYYKRFALYVVNSEIVQAFYPCFPPHLCAQGVLEWLGEHVRS